MLQVQDWACHLCPELLLLPFLETLCFTQSETWVRFASYFSLTLGWWSVSAFGCSYVLPVSESWCFAYPHVTLLGDTLKGGPRPGHPLHLQMDEDKAVVLAGSVLERPLTAVGNLPRL